MNMRSSKADVRGSNPLGCANSPQNSWVYPLISNCFRSEFAGRVDQTVHRSSPYLYTKRNVYYFSRRVPKGLSGYFSSARIVFSLKTKSHCDRKFGT
ncbi:MAG: DUF6538 domain-containing protein [Rhizobiaceae bacterium]